MKKLYLFILFINGTASMYAQLDSIQHLTEVMVIDAKLEDYSEGFELIWRRWSVFSLQSYF